jgi:hypothetical protein
MPSDLIPMPERFDGPYCVFSRENDLELQADQLETAIKPLGDWNAFPSPNYAEFVQRHAKSVATAELQFATHNRGQCFTETAVTVLLDHSGSLRGDKICLVVLLAGIASAVCALLAFGMRF